LLTLIAAEEQTVDEVSENSSEVESPETGEDLSVGVNPLAIIIPLIALLVTLVGAIGFFALRTSYVKHEARSALQADNQQLTQSAFVRAITDGSPEMVKRYLDAGLETKEKISPETSPLTAAITRGNVKILELVLNRSLPLNENSSTFIQKATPKESIQRECFSGDSPPINFAAAKSRPAALELVARYSERSIHGDGVSLSPLVCAVANDNIPNIEWLLDHGADPNRLEKRERSALSYAIIFQRLGALQLLLQRGGNTRVQLSYGETPIFDGARDGNEAIISLLLQNPVDLNKANFKGEKPWQVAEAAGKLELIPLLHPEYLLYAGLSKQNPRFVSFALERGARVNVSDRDGVTPLHVAISEGTPNKSRYLIRVQGGISLSAIGNSTPLRTDSRSLAQQFENVRRLIKKLEQNGDAPSAATLNGEDSLYGKLSAPSILLEEIDGGHSPYVPGTVLPALREDTHSLTQILLLGKADPNARDTDGNSPLHYAVQRGELPLVQELLDAGANYELQNSAAVTPLLLAIRLKRPDIAALFLDTNPPQERDSRLESALLAASENGQNGVAIKLLKLGVSPELKDKAHRSLIIMALAGSNFELAQALRDAGATLDLTERTAQSLYLFARRSKEKRLLEFFEKNASGQNEISPEALERVIQRREK